VTSKLVVLGSLVLCSTIVSGVLHGLETHRWGVPGSRERAAARLSAVPVQFGNWSSDELELSERERRMAGADAAYWRTFADIGSASGSDSISVLLLSGSTGPIACHPPTICFQGAGYELISEPVKVPVPGTGDTLWCADFRTVTTPPLRLRAYWAWGGDDAFVASEWPRIDFAGHPNLYKAYFTRVGPAIDEPPDEDPIVEFAKEFLPLADRQLFGTDSGRVSRIARRSPPTNTK
jgi:hypothetical protein